MHIKEEEWGRERGREVKRDRKRERDENPEKRDVSKTISAAERKMIDSVEVHLYR